MQMDLFGLGGLGYWDELDFYTFISSFFILSFHVTPQVHLKIRITATWTLVSWGFLVVEAGPNVVLRVTLH